MKSLYESILDSTNSGKNKKLTKEYLLKDGFKCDSSDDVIYSIKLTDFCIHYIENDGVLFRSPVYDFEYKYIFFINTISDLEQLKKLWYVYDQESGRNTKVFKKALDEMLSKVPYEKKKRFKG